MEADSDGSGRPLQAPSCARGPHVEKFQRNRPGNGMISRRTFVASVAPAAATPRALAQTSPPRPIRIIVPFAPGGPSDVMARVAAHRMSAILGQQLFVENRGGAGGTLGARAAAQAEPDGYTLMLGTTSTL